MNKVPHLKPFPLNSLINLGPKYSSQGPAFEYP